MQGRRNGDFTVIEIIGVRFKSVGKIYYFAPNGFKLNAGGNVIVETARGIEFGTVVIPNRMINEKEVFSPLKPVIRIATEKDAEIHNENAEKAKAAFALANEKIAKHKLDMKLVDVEYTFDGGKILFYFTADGRVDFRELVKDLAAIFRTRIELRQIGVRDEAKMLSGLGVCGRQLCCSSFLGEFIPVSIKMAKEQGLSLNPVKISGTCGRLMCCLKYEQDTYEHMGVGLPGVGALVKTPDGNGTVFAVTTLKRCISVKFEAEHVIKEYSIKDIKILKNVSRNENDDEIAILKELEEN